MNRGDQNLMNSTNCYLQYPAPEQLKIVSKDWSVSCLPQGVFQHIRID